MMAAALLHWSITHLPARSDLCRFCSFKWALEMAVFLFCSLDSGRTDSFIIIIIEMALSKGQNILASTESWRNCIYPIIL